MLNFDDTGVVWLIAGLLGLVLGLALAWLYWKLAKPGQSEIDELEHQIEIERQNRPSVLAMADRIAQERLAATSSEAAAKDAVIVDLRAQLTESSRRLEAMQQSVSDIRAQLECVTRAPKASVTRSTVQPAVSPLAEAVIDLRSDRDLIDRGSPKTNPFPRPDRGFRRPPNSDGG